MNKLFFDSGISLDGFLAGDHRGPQNPLGDGGMSIHNWMYEGGQENGPESKLVEDTLARTGSYIMGKRMFEEGEPNWPEDLYKADVYVLTHEKRDPWVQKGTTVFHFINDGIESAVKKAKNSSRGKDIRIQGGAETIQQFLNAGLVDEFILHISPVILGSGIRLFEGIDKTKFIIEIAEVIPGGLSTHVKYNLKLKDQ
ncbi:RibD domain-containing protein [Anseongella ginsenosidimutans]|uniref:RibD domain-containing protein n=1 Tax=Anseongella ginsenosidimutans TaxID=496056 RepID=A0A4R3KQ02_9SPHI|nr:dihydrofolate reductase family protein [Anseongella ginsenosidimutans]QEC52673.1 dihydrofolate reductase [Anseongella ginsenosidimutans]TCS86601.1 RibD domain-containing protein [Anseongella ginsenosidimutans]